MTVVGLLLTARGHVCCRRQVLSTEDKTIELFVALGVGRRAVAKRTKFRVGTKFQKEISSF